MYYSRFLLFALTILMSFSIHAETKNDNQFVKEWYWVGSLSGGPIWESGGKTQTFYLNPGIEKTYSALPEKQNLMSGEFFLGLQKTLNQVLLGQLGFAIAATQSATLSGNIWDDADITFNNFVYVYQLQHFHVALKGKVLLDKGYWVTPWVGGSLGIGFNHAYGFRNAPLIPEAIVNPNFSSNTQSSFTYTLSLGVQRALNKTVQVGVSYEFSDWGRSRLNPMPQQTLNSGLALRHLYTNGIMLSLIFIA